MFVTVVPTGFLRTQKPTRFNSMIYQVRKMKVWKMLKKNKALEKKLKMRRLLSIVSLNIGLYFVRCYQLTLILILKQKDDKL